MTPTRNSLSNESLYFKIWKTWRGAFELRGAAPAVYPCIPIRVGEHEQDTTEVESRKLKISRVERVWRKTYPKPSCLLCSQYTPEGWAADTTHTHTNGTDGLHT